MNAVGVVCGALHIHGDYDEMRRCRGREDEVKTVEVKVSDADFPRADDLTRRADALQKALFVRMELAQSTILAIGEVIEDMASGRVPWNVASFGDLHDYVDANEYGGLCDDARFGDTDKYDNDFANEVQDAVDRWIKGELSVDGPALAIAARRA